MITQRIMGPTLAQAITTVFYRDAADWKWCSRAVPDVAGVLVDGLRLSEVGSVSTSRWRQRGRSG